VGPCLVHFFLRTRHSTSTAHSRHHTPSRQSSHSMESSRIFVRNLPSHFTEDDVRKHFAKFPITDVKFFNHRRIGYVGYKTPEDAAKAVKYFNKTFIKLTKIYAEIARPVCTLRSQWRRAGLTCADRRQGTAKVTTTAEAREERPSKRRVPTATTRERPQAETRGSRTGPEAERVLGGLSAAVQDQHLGQWRYSAQ
jgi:RNA recognition motif-containing protein